VLHALTGFPVFKYVSLKQQNFFFKIYDYLKKVDMESYIMTTGIDGVDIYNNICDIRTGHEYSLLSAFEMIDGNNITHKVLMIRDPHGESDYNCSWNMNDTNWTEDLIK